MNDSNNDPKVLGQVTKLTDSTMVSKEERERDVRAAIERIFEDGVVPSGVIIFADFGPGSDKVRVSCSGPTAELVPLAIAGNQSLSILLKHAVNSAIEGNKLNG